jgi:hypothetical protein
MKIRTALISSAFVFATGTSFAADQSIDLSSGFASFIGTPTLLDGGDDVISFTNLAAGTYNFEFTMSSQFTNITSVTVNGQEATMASFGNFRFFGLESVSDAPFEVRIEGTANSRSLYSGELQVAAIPEPETYALMLAGLAAVGFMARRRRQGTSV